MVSYCGGVIPPDLSVPTTLMRYVPATSPLTCTIPVSTTPDSHPLYTDPMEELLGPAAWVNVMFATPALAVRMAPTDTVFPACVCVAVHWVDRQSVWAFAKNGSERTARIKIFIILYVI